MKAREVPPRQHCWGGSPRTCCATKFQEGSRFRPQRQQKRPNTPRSEAGSAPQLLLYKPNFVRLQFLRFALYRIVLPVRMRIQFGSGRLRLRATAKVFLTLRDLWLREVGGRGE